jgi:NAD(P)-dependent dehydrogenase (short-subunit alcohol dehydrogenase family)
MRGLAGKVAIVTGGASGIGRATVLRLVEEGASVVVADINEEAATALADDVSRSGASAYAVFVDVSDHAAIEVMVEESVRRYGGLDILHNNAAVITPDFFARDGDILDLDLEVFDRTVAVNLRGPLLACKYAIPWMLERGKGSIVNTASLAGLRGMFVNPIYAMTKGGLIALTMQIAASYGKRGIRCNAVAPGTTATSINTPADDPARHEARLLQVLTTRLGEPDDVAAMVAFLASDDAAHITGQTFMIDGGRGIMGQRLDDLGRPV